MIFFFKLNYFKIKDDSRERKPSKISSRSI
jgi:hypothetical protein